MSLHTTVVNAPTIGKVRISSCNPINIFVNGVYMGATGNEENPSLCENAPHGSSTTTVCANMIMTTRTNCCTTEHMSK